MEAMEVKGVREQMERVIRMGDREEMGKIGN